MLALFVGVATLVCAEGVLRVALFSDYVRVEGLRDPRLFGDYRSDQVFWKLQTLFLKPDERKPGPARHPILGWRGSLFSDDFVHRDEASMGNRRPILLFGDSFAACATPPEDCFQGLFTRSERGQEEALLNYGVGGYGVDQVSLLMQRVVNRLSWQRPVVIVSVLWGDDFNRCGLEFRNWPKPKFQLSDTEGLELLLPSHGVEDRWLEENPPNVTSYLWRWYLYGSTLPPWNYRMNIRSKERRRRVEALRPVCEELTRSMCRFLQDRADEVDFFFLLLPSLPDLERPSSLAIEGISKRPIDWGEELLEEVLTELSVPFVNARKEFTQAFAQGQKLGSFFRPGDGHYNPEGNEVAFRALLRGLATFVD